VLSLLGGVLAVGDGGGATGAALGLGALLCFASVVTFTFGSRWTVTAFPALTPLGRTTVTLTGAAIATGAAALIAHLAGGPVPDWAALGWREAGALAIFAIGGLAVSQLLWIISVGQLGIALSSLHINMTPFYVMLILFALGGRWDWLQALGAAVVLAGVLVAQGLIAPPRRNEA
jgi:drug/metabolite transporter (DMT)-like permease